MVLLKVVDTAGSSEREDWAHEHGHWPPAVNTENLSWSPKFNPFTADPVKDLHFAILV